MHNKLDLNPLVPCSVKSVSDGSDVWVIKHGTNAQLKEPYQWNVTMDQFMILWYALAQVSQ